RLVLDAAGVAQHRRVALREQVAVRHRIAARAGGIGADAAVEREGMLQRVELAFGKRGNPPGEALRLADLPGRGLGQYRHDGETLSGRPGQGNRAGPGTSRQSSGSTRERYPPAPRGGPKPTPCVLTVSRARTMSPEALKSKSRTAGTAQPGLTQNARAAPTSKC